MSKLSKFKQQVACFHVIFIASNMYCEKIICRIARIETPGANDKNVFLPIIPVWILQGLERKSYSCKVETFIEELDETTPETEFALRFSCNTGRLLRTPTADNHCNTDRPLHTPTADNHCNTDRPLHTPTADNHYTQKGDSSFRYPSRFDIDVFDERVLKEYYEIKCAFNPVKQKKSIDSRGLNERFFGNECKHTFLGAGHPMPFQLTTLEENLCENSCGLGSIRLQHPSLINTNFPKEKYVEDKRDCFYTHIQQLWEFPDGRFTEDKSEYTDTHIRQPTPVETKSVDNIFCMEKFEDINLILRKYMPHDFSACNSQPFIVDSKVMKSRLMRRKWDNTLSANLDDMLCDIINDQNNNGNSNEHDSDDRKAEPFQSSVTYYCSSLAMPESVKPVDEIQQLFTEPNESFPKNDNVQKLLVNYIALIHLLATSDYRQQLYSCTPVKTGSHEWEDTENVDNKDKSLSWNEQCIVLHTDKCTIEDNHLLCHEKSTITTVDSHLECEGKRSSTYEDCHWSCKDKSDIPAADNDWNKSKMKKLYLFLCLMFCVLKLLLQVEYKKVVHDVNKTRDGTSSVCQRSDGALRKEVTHGSQGKHTRRGYTFLANEHILTGADKRYTVAKVRNVTDIKRQKNSAMKSQDRVADNTHSLTSNQLLCSSAMLLSRRMNVLQNMDVVVYCCLHLEENNDENLAPYLPSSFVKDDLGLGLLLHFTKPISTRIQLHDSHFAFKALYQASFSHRRVNFSSDSWALMYRLRTQIWGSLGPMEIARPISQSKGEIDIKWVFQMQKSVRMALAAKVHDSPLRPSLLPQVLQCSRYGVSHFFLTEVLQCSRYGVSHFFLTEVMQCSRYGVSNFFLTEVMQCSRYGVSHFFLTEVMQCSRYGVSHFYLTEVMQCRRPDVSHLLLPKPLQCSRPDMSHLLLPETFQCSRPDVSRLLLPETLQCSRPDMSHLLLPETLQCSRPDVSHVKVRLPYPASILTTCYMQMFLVVVHLSECFGRKPFFKTIWSCWSFDRADRLHSKSFFLRVSAIAARERKKGGASNVLTFKNQAHNYISQSQQFEKFPVTVIHVKTVFRYQHSFRGGIACSFEEFQITESDGNDADRPDKTQNTKNDSSKQNQQGDSFDDQGSSGDKGDHDDGNSSAGGGGGSDGGGGGGGGGGRKDDDDDSPDGHHRDDTQTRNQLVKLLKCLLQWFYILHPLPLTFSANLHNPVKVPSTWCFIRRQLLSILNSFSSSNVNFKLRLRIAQHCVKEFSTKMAQINWTKVRRIRDQNCCLWVYYLIDDSDNTDDEHTEHSDPSPGPPDTQGLSAMDGTSTIGSITRQRTSSSSDSRNGNNGLVPENNPGILGLGENQHNGNDNEDTQLLQRLEDLLHRSQSPQLLALTWHPVETPRLPIQCTDSENYRHSDQAPGATFDVYVEPTHRIQIKLRGDKVLTSFTHADLNRVYTDSRDETISMRHYLPIEETQPPLGELNGPIRQPGNILMEDLSIIRRRQYRLLRPPDTVTNRTVNHSGSEEPRRVNNSNSHRRSFQESHPHPDSRTVPCPGNTSIENLPFVRESQNRQILPPHPSTNTTGNETVSRDTASIRRA